MLLRPATPADVPLLRGWDAQPHVIASDPNSDWQWEVELARTPPWRESLVAELDGRPIGFVEIIDPELEDEHYWGDCGPGLRAVDIWIGEADELGRGHGTVMMGLAIERCFADPGVRAILIDPLASNVGAVRFYRRLGFRHVEDRWFGSDHCAVHRLDRRTDPSDVSGLEVRLASWAEVRALQFSVLRPHGPLPDDGPPPEGSLHVGAFDGHAVGAATVSPARYPGPGSVPEPAWQLRGVGVRADWRGLGVGRRVLEIAVDAARSAGAGGLWAAARVEALPLYLAAGWTARGPEWAKPGVGPHRYVSR